MKRTCDGCKALSVDLCLLGYNNKVKSHLGGIVLEYMPAEECPKPKTNMKLFQAARKQ